MYIISLISLYADQGRIAGKQLRFFFGGGEGESEDELIVFTI